MKIEEIQTIQVDAIVNVICDCCGKSVKNAFGGFDFMELKSEWGYFSNKDLQTWTAHLCENCVDEKLSFIKFKIKTHA